MILQDVVGNIINFFFLLTVILTLLYLYKTLRKDTADSLTSLPMTKKKKIMESNKQQALCIQLIQGMWKNCALCGRAVLERMKYCNNKDLDEIMAVLV